jgi:hypothetical protein
VKKGRKIKTHRRLKVNPPKVIRHKKEYIRTREKSKVRSLKKDD